MQFVVCSMQVLSPAGTAFDFVYCQQYEHGLLGTEHKPAALTHKQNASNKCKHLLRRLPQSCPFLKARLRCSVMHCDKQCIGSTFDATDNI